jgi:drug/metabolite transporter (DMT)-like permease
VIFFAGGGYQKLRKLHVKDIAVLAAVSLPSFLYYIFYSSALSRCSAVQASLLNYTFPIFIFLLSWPINGEKPTVRSLIAVLAGFVGVAVLLGFDFTAQQSQITGSALALLAAFCWGLFSNLGKWVRQDVETANFFYILFGFIYSLIGLFIFSSPALLPPQSLFGAAWNGVFSFAIGYALWFRIIRTAPLSLAANLSFIAPFVNLLFIALLLHEPIGLRQVAGLCVIMAGVFFQGRFTSSAKKKQKD